jgi:hypothetical protein
MGWTGRGVQAGNAVAVACLQDAVTARVSVSAALQVCAADFAAVRACGVCAQCAVLCS